MLDFRSIETFLWVVKLGSFRGAAQRLNTTQPAISQRIAGLEREMGVRLLNREHRVASPTPSGRQMMVYAEKLFDAFHRLHGDKDFKGSGIGLATVARIVRRHHGRIWTDSVVGRGATFWFTLG